MTERLRNRILKRLMEILHDGRIPWPIRVTAECSTALEVVVDQIRHGENPAEALNAFVSQWARN